MLTWYRVDGYSYDREISHFAALRENLEVLKWCRIRNMWTCACTAKRGHLEVLRSRATVMVQNMLLDRRTGVRHVFSYTCTSALRRKLRLNVRCCSRRQTFVKNIIVLFHNVKIPQQRVGQTCSEEPMAARGTSMLPPSRRGVYRLSNGGDLRYAFEFHGEVLSLPRTGI